MREVVIASGKNVFGTFRVTDDLCIALHLHGGFLAGAVEDGERCTSLILAGYDIDAAVRNELSLLALGDDFIAQSPVQQSAGPTEHILFGLGAPFFRKSVMCITGESAGEVLTHMTVGYLLGAVHQYLRSIIDLWNAVDGQQQGECLLEGERVLSVSQEAVGIVIVDEGHDR